eukprot:2336541-Pyramimonas_sp.AAC.1
MQAEKHRANSDGQTEQHRHKANCISQLLMLAQASPAAVWLSRRRPLSWQYCLRRVRRRLSRSVPGDLTR